MDVQRRVILVILFSIGSMPFLSTTLFSQEVRTTGQKVNPSLTFEQNLQDTLVTAGYGASSRGSISGAISTVSEEDFNKGLVSDPLLLIQGKVAGMQIYNRGGDPNLSSISRVRGLSSFANRNPLIVIDGVVGASLQNIDPNDIASITVLKDGSAQAIYGMRASNGVILIDSKAETSNRDTLSLSYQGQLGVSTPYPSIPVMNADDFRMAGGTDLGASTNWLDAVKQTGLSNTHGLALQGRKGKTNYRLSGNYRDVEGVLQNSGFDQFNLRANLNTGFLNDALKLSISASFTDRNSQLGFNEAFRYALSFNPTVPLAGTDVPFPHDADRFGGFFETIGLFDSFNPKAIVELNERNGRLQALTSTALLEYKVTPGLTLNFRYAYQDQLSNERAYYSPQSYFRGNANSPFPENRGRADLTDIEDSFSLYELFGNYHKSFGETSLGLTLGTAYQNGQHQDRYLGLDGFSNEALLDRKRIGHYDTWASEAVNTDTVNNSWSDKVSSIFTRVNLNFANKVIVNASMRYDGSSLLGENNRWGLFPAFGIAMNLNELWGLPTFDQLKFRMAYGVTGGIPQQGGLSKEQIVLVEQEDGSIIPDIRREANPGLKWEQKNEFNIGFDFQLGKVSGFIDWYTRRVEDWINLDYSSSRFNYLYTNKNALKSQGIDLGLDFQVVDQRNFQYTTGVIAATFQSEYDDLTPDQSFILTPCCGALDPYVPLQEGENVGNIIGPVFVGTHTDHGPIFKDINEDGYIEITGLPLDPRTDFAVLGNGLPDVELGWKNQIQAFGWHLNVFFRGAFGHSLVNIQRYVHEPRPRSSRPNFNLTDTELAIEELEVSRFSSLYIEKANFFKLDNLSISRNFPINIGQRNNNLSISLTGQNLFVITNYTGTDPEPVLEDRGSTRLGSQQPSMNEANPLAPGIDRRNFYLPSRTFVIGMGLMF